MLKLIFLFLAFPLVVSLPEGSPFQLLVSAQGKDTLGRAPHRASEATQREASAIRLSAYCGAAAEGGLECWQETHPESEEKPWAKSSTDEEEDHSSRPLDGTASEG